MEKHENLTGMHMSRESSFQRLGAIYRIVKRKFVWMGIRKELDFSGGKLRMNKKSYTLKLVSSVSSNLSVCSLILFSYDREQLSVRCECNTSLPTFKFRTMLSSMTTKGIHPFWAMPSQVLSIFWPQVTHGLEYAKCFGFKNVTRNLRLFFSRA
jgi:hypothetical protein